MTPKEQLLRSGERAGVLATWALALLCTGLMGCGESSSADATSPDASREADVSPRPRLDAGTSGGDAALANADAGSAPGDAEAGADGATKVDPRRALVETYAPLVWLGQGESYFPSSVEWAFPFVERWANPDDGGRYSLRTKATLSSPSDRCGGQDASGACMFFGNLASAAVYAFWIEKPPYADVAYFFYYPYNRGKTLVSTLWGNHVGDWEHMTLRLLTVTSSTAVHWMPARIYLSQHSSGEVVEWTDVPKTADGHPIIYSAEGSHGVYKTAGVHTYKTTPIGDLSDVCGEGTRWETWKRVEAYDGATKRGLLGEPWPTWMRTDYTNAGTGNPADPSTGAIYRWGNTKQGCDAPSFITDECRLVDGPTGPVEKSCWDPKLLE